MTVLPSSRRYAVLGTGALGGFYGARLQQSGQEVHFLLRSDYDWVQQHGLWVESVDGDFELPQVKAYADVSEMPPCNVVIVALKTTQNHLLPKLVPPVLSDQGVVLVLQNGLGVEPVVADLVGSDRVLGGLCFICANKVGPGHIRHLDYKKIALGEYGDDYQAVGVTDRMRTIATDFEQAGIPIDLEPDLLQTRWKKLVWNIPFNGLSVVLDARTDEMMADPHSRQLAEALMQEVVAAAAASGRTLPDDLVRTMLSHTEQMEPYRTSMKIDYDEHRPLEVEAIFGTPLRVAQQAGAHLPRIETLYQLLKFLDAQNLKQS
jgi:2-dehydropantoate 2-reductase